MSAIVTAVDTVIRYAGLVALVLVASVVVMVCGEGLHCGGHACSFRAADRLKRTASQVVDRVISVVRVEPLLLHVASTSRFVETRVWTPPSSQKAVDLLRI